MKFTKSETCKVRRRLSAWVVLAVAVIGLAALLNMSATIGFTQSPPPFVEAGLPGNAFAGVVPAPNGRLYGVTYVGGTSNLGTLYSVDAALSAVVVHVNFSGSNGKVPYDELTYDATSAKFYGTTSSGGSGNIGTIFSFDPTTNALVTLKDDFLGYYQPQGPFVISGGFIYGVMSSPNGAVFRMAIDGSDFTILYGFTDFRGPLPLTLGQDGRLYGATVYGGIVCDRFRPYGCGTVFRLRAVLPGDPDVQFETLYQIQDVLNSNPLRRPVYGSDGLLYFNNHLRILRLDPNNPASTLQTIWAETGGSVSMSIIEAADSRLYVTSYDNTQSRAGRIFSINKDGTGPISLRNFSFTTGSTAYGPYGFLYRSPTGTVYGTTEYTNLVEPYNGTVFAINPTNNTSPVLSNVAVTSPINENDTATLSGNITDSDAGDVFSMTVNWGDGSPPQVFNYAAGTTAFSETHQYLDDNPTGTSSDNYSINLSLSDNNGGNDTDSVVVTVNDVRPELSNIIPTPSTITIGSAITLTGNISDPGTLDTYQILIGWGDGSPDTTLNLGAGTTAFSTNHQYNVDGTFAIGVIASDDDGPLSSGGVGVMVVPLSAPVLSNVAVTSLINENDVATLTGNITDPNPGDTFTLNVDWGDGSPAQVFNYPAGTTSFNQTHQYLDDNPSGTTADNKTINLLLSDSTGRTDSKSTVIAVNNVAPGLSNISANPATINLGSTTNLSGTVIDAGSLDTHQIVIDWGDGLAPTTLNLPAGVTTFNAGHQYNVSGNFNIAVTATDDDTGSATSGISVTVTSSPQQPPVLSNVAVTTPINENDTAALTGNISDPNASDTFLLIVNWGDGSPAQGFNYPAGTNSFSLAHQYRDDNPSGTPSDNYSISLQLFDSGGDNDSKSTVITVNNLPPTLSGIAANPSSIVNGGTTILSGNVNDVGTLDTHTVVINWGDGSPATTLNLAAGDTAFNSTHQYNLPGVFNIGVTATDDDTGSATGEATVTVVQNEKIVFASYRDDNGEIYVMNSDGTNQTRLTNNPAQDNDPSFNSDGSRIVFTSYRDGQGEIYVMNADGTNQTRLTFTNSAVEAQPRFCADGSKIIFISNRDNLNGIWIMNSDGTNQTRLTKNPGGFDFVPTFSPDGSKIAFASLRGKNYDIWIMNANGSNQTQLTTDAAVDIQPAFSPDGSRIAFRSNRSDNNEEIYVMNTDGTNATRLTFNAAYDASPSFSPDGSRIAFASYRDGNLEIYSMNPDGSNPTRLTINSSDDLNPSFRLPIQEKIVFYSIRDGNPEIYIMNADGSNQTRLTNNPANDLNPALSPDGSRIAFASDRGGNSGIYVMNADGSNPTPLSKPQSYDIEPAFSRDGRRIVFTSFRDGNLEIYVMNADGSNQKRLTTIPAADGSPKFSADGRIVFASARDGNDEIYVMNADGTNQRNLTNNPGYDNIPSVSPDGSKIAFVSDRDGNWEIYVMNADGTNQTRLTNNPAIDFRPSFSPDGSLMSFASDRDGYSQIYVMNADGSNQTNVSNSPSWDAQAAFRPAYRPATEKIAFRSLRDGNAEIYIMNTDGSNQTNLTNNPADENSPAISADGRRIAFASNRDDNNSSEIYVMNSDGSNQTRLTNSPAFDTTPAFSPDGSRIVFSSNAQIYVMNADGTNQTRLTNNGSLDRDPKFNPDGSRIVFASNRYGNPDIFIMNNDGTNQTRLTNHPGNDTDPVFSPDGSRIAYSSFRGNNYEIFIMNSDGTNPVRLTNSPAEELVPSFSPAGGRIAFTTNRDGNREIYVMDADGANQTRLTTNPASDYYPSWGG
jgi:uncharacterized repeat protein (TIGR03803 family)